MSANATSWRHHYVPQFYLRCWTDTCSGKVWQYKREPSGKLSEKPVPTKTTGFGQDLYTAKDILPYFPERTPDSIEHDFFGPLDNAAAVILGKLVRDLNSLNAEERSTWALFLNSLLERHPVVLEQRDADAHRVAIEVAEEALARCPTPGSRARMAELLGDMDLSAVGQNTAREHMVREICDPDVLRAFLVKQWKVVHVGPVLKLITSDRPLVINCGYSSSPIEMLTISLSPSHLFLMHPLSWEMDEDFLNSIIVFHNLTLIEADNGYLYSMGRIEDGPIVKTRKAVEGFFNPRKLGRPAVITRAVAETANCWFDVDRVSNDPASTTWKRAARLRQAQWREVHGYPIGAEPYAGGDGSTLVGSRIALDFARTTGSNFLAPNILAAVRARLANPEPGQTLKEERLWADLLSSMPLCFNLFGQLHADADLAASAVRAWWPDAPTGNVTVRFEHSPGRRDPLFLGNKTAADVAFEVEKPDGTFGIIGVETKYHEDAKAEPIPKPKALARYEEVTERSGVFKPDWRAAIVGTELQQVWLDHLLVLSMMQHPSKRWSWGRFVLVYPAENPSFARAAAQYREVLTDATTFETRTIEGLLDVEAVLPEGMVSAFRERYLRCPP